MYMKIKQFSHHVMAIQQNSQTLTFTNGSTFTGQVVNGQPGSSGKFLTASGEHGCLYHYEEERFYETSTGSDSFITTYNTVYLYDSCRFGELTDLKSGEITFSPFALYFTCKQQYISQHKDQQQNSKEEFRGCLSWPIGMKLVGVIQNDKPAICNEQCKFISNNGKSGLCTISGVNTWVINFNNSGYFGILSSTAITTLKHYRIQCKIKSDILLNFQYNGELMGKICIKDYCLVGLIHNNELCNGCKVSILTDRGNENGLYSKCTNTVFCYDSGRLGHICYERGELQFKNYLLHFEQKDDFIEQNSFSCNGKQVTIIWPNYNKYEGQIRINQVEAGEIVLNDGLNTRVSVKREYTQKLLVKDSKTGNLIDFDFETGITSYQNYFADEQRKKEQKQAESIHIYKQSSEQQKGWFRCQDQKNNAESYK